MVYVTRTRLEVFNMDTCPSIGFSNVLKIYMFLAYNKCLNSSVKGPTRVLEGKIKGPINIEVGSILGT